MVEKGRNVYECYKKIKLVGAIIFTDLSWTDIKKTTIKNCFKHLHIITTATIEEEKIKNDKKVDDFVNNFINKTKIFNGVLLSEYINVEYTEEGEIMCEMENFEVDNCEEFGEESVDKTDSADGERLVVDERDVTNSINLLIRYL